MDANIGVRIHRFLYPHADFPQKKIVQEDVSHIHLPVQYLDNLCRMFDMHKDPVAKWPCNTDDGSVYVYTGYSMFF